MKKLSHVLRKPALFMGLLLLGWSVQAQEDADKGQELFLSKCASCHTATKDKLTGPGLQGVHERREREWLLKWIRNSQALVEAKDPDAVALFNEYNQVVMNSFPDLKDEDIDNILAFIKRGPKKEEPVAQAASNAPDFKGSAKPQLAEWTATSTGMNSETLIPLIVLPMFLLVVGFATIKIPGMKD